MKKTIISIATIMILITSVLLGDYFDTLYQNEKLAGIKLHIYPADKNFIETTDIQKLIKIKDSSLKEINAEKIEKELENNDYVSNAEVYKDLNGKIVAEIEQYHPIARVLGQTSYYIDLSGEKKPLSNRYTENVVLVFGEIKKNNQKEIIELIKKINQDEILNNIISEIHIKNRHITLKTNDLKADITIDPKGKIEKELSKLKTIYAYLVKQNLENKYQNIDLRYDKQAVCK